VHSSLTAFIEQRAGFKLSATVPLCYSSSHY